MDGGLIAIAVVAYLALAVGVFADTDRLVGTRGDLTDTEKTAARAACSVLWPVMLVVLVVIGCRALVRPRIPRARAVPARHDDDSR